MPVTLRRCAAVLLSLVLLAGVAFASSRTASAGEVRPGYCRKDPLAGVWGPGRLEVVDPCVTVSGVVTGMHHHSDNDYHVLVDLDEQYASLVNDVNDDEADGDLIVEIIPMDQPKLTIPAVGDRVTITGAYVLDRNEGWMEIHPAWLVNGEGSVTYTAVEAAESAAKDVPGDGE